MNLAKSICISLLILLIVAVVNANAVGVTVGPDGKPKTAKLQLPFAFYNQSFGAAVGYVYGVGGWPQNSRPSCLRPLAALLAVPCLFSSERTCRYRSGGGGLWIR